MPSSARDTARDASAYNRHMTRRELMAMARRLAAAGAAAPFVPAARLRAQDAWGKDRLIRLSAHPPDYETPVALLDSAITPAEHFFVRSHLPVPTPLDAAAWRLAVDGEVRQPLSLSVSDLRALRAVTTTVTLECAGNGRAFFTPPVAGIQWTKGAVGTARWTGARLADILARAGAAQTARWVHMSGADRPPGTMPPFVRQVPMAKAVHPDTIVAYEMNGQPIPPVHGFPLRAIIPGWEGAYAMKWLTRLHVSTTGSDSFWVAAAYRYPVRRVAPGAAVDAKDMAPLTGLVVKSLITTPLDGATLGVGPVTVGGFAWAGETDIARVEVSTDHGVTWRPAQLIGSRQQYTWRRFAYRFIADRPASYLLLSRATDARGSVQPAVAHWNPSGYLWNQYDAVRVEVR
jgi:DMSO/TMAO reductase YedYZ molybdopterin-dependent catalytic subunit